MAQYLMSVHHREGDPLPTGEEAQAMFAAVDVFNAGLQENGHWVFAGGLEPPETATLIRIGESGDAVLTDGPYAETKEHIGGFWVIEAADLDEALRLGEAGARACGGPVEVRPFQALPD